MMVGQFATGTTWPWDSIKMASTIDVMAAHNATVPWLWRGACLID